MHHKYVYYVLLHILCDLLNIIYKGFSCLIRHMFCYSILKQLCVELF